MAGIPESLTLPEHVRIDEPAPDYPVLDIRHPRASARVALHGAHVLEWAPVGYEPVLYLSPKAVYQKGTPIRGGVPVCWPWFDNHPTDPNLPRHGFARTRFWELDEVRDSDEATHLQFSLTPGPDSREMWPFPFALKLRVSVGLALVVSLEATNTGETSFIMGGALHTYFLTGDAEEAVISGLDGTRYSDKTVDPPEERQQKSDVLFQGEVDQIHQSASTLRLYDPSMRRSITIEKEGSHSTVVWNPGKEKAAAFPDLPDEDFRKFVCVEAALAGDDVREVYPGESHTLMTRLRVQRSKMPSNARVER